MLDTLSKVIKLLVRDKSQQEVSSQRCIKELQEDGELHIHQYRFQKDKSTVQAVNTAIETIKEYKCKLCALITMDVKNAFNTAQS